MDGFLAGRSILMVPSHSSNPPFFKGGGLAFLKMGLRGGSKILVFKGGIPKRGGIKNKGGGSDPSPH